jgi:hypothetical protein
MVPMGNKKLGEIIFEFSHQQKELIIVFQGVAECSRESKESYIF